MGVVKDNSMRGQFIEERASGKRIAVGTEMVGPQGVDGDEEDPINRPRQIDSWSRVATS
jgi:hypothetical protein